MVGLRIANAFLQPISEPPSTVSQSASATQYPRDTDDGLCETLQGNALSSTRPSAKRHGRGMVSAPRPPLTIGSCAQEPRPHVHNGSEPDGVRGVANKVLMVGVDASADGAPCDDQTAAPHFSLDSPLYTPSLENPTTICLKRRHSVHGSSVSFLVPSADIIADRHRFECTARLHRPLLRSDAYT